MWKSLRLFSPAQWSSLPGVMMPGGGNYYPTREEVLDYLKNYESKYQLPIIRSVQVVNVRKEKDYFVLETSQGEYETQVVVAASGSFTKPFIPEYDGMKLFQGKIIHSSAYISAEEWMGKRVAIVGEGNSGAQILAEVSNVTDTLWITLKEPRFLPDHMDGRFLFDAATQMYEAKKQGKAYQPPSLGDVVMVPSVKEARERNVLKSIRPFQKFGADRLLWADGHEEKVDGVIFCTGLRPAISYLDNLNIITPEGRVTTEETKATLMRGLWLVGFGNWTGFASATLIGVGRSAKQTVEEIQNYLKRD
jgi:thioredoxin reductase